MKLMFLTKLMFYLGVLCVAGTNKTEQKNMIKMI